MSLLASKKLTDNNFVKWKNNMYIALLYNNYKFVLIEKCPLKPTINATQTI